MEVNKVAHTLKCVCVSLTSKLLAKRFVMNCNSDVPMILSSLNGEQTMSAKTWGRLLYPNEGEGLITI